MIGISIHHKEECYVPFLLHFGEVKVGGGGGFYQFTPVVIAVAQ